MKCVVEQQSKKDFIISLTKDDGEVLSLEGMNLIAYGSSKEEAKAEMRERVHQALLRQERKTMDMMKLLRNA